ncbi:bifunctional adenosylcobinamide kinase/adenosylcobinamide-phosphate guanylyltransferase [Spirulina sp. CS-785/01]|uniref:bifunctional adenosylcobinamide kinase/adenosylcobinamide-phosphate guanylyltransferase n=1 Tax=Spirulina sp. CS-785/01 TaxID=3021716 RepID=UPI00232AB379|nr:bifunctional adenosylcobinamide kinase/adenosylcobinamide-phosphate guanylyltransferase [Spirulina sp. CS-785/01]MDB9313223.1 bifunctional adenosylcobinamide kinase/adenosylcobinamide-phosphate guanylyltransferase [Spirulina sp. CS-785/01]
MNQQRRKIILVTGPASSGKSEWAEQWATQQECPVSYVATAQPLPDDEEWMAKIQKHAQRRPPEWETLAIPVALGEVLGEVKPDRCLLVDSLGTWVANLLEQEETTWEKTVQDLLTQLQQGEGTVIFVAEEVGWGVVPAYPLGRKFRDRIGQITRQISTLATEVYLVTGGYVLPLHHLGQPLSKGNV